MKEQFPPTNPFEDKMLLLLVMKGYPRHELEFKDCETGRYLRYGYWEYILPEDCAYVKEHSGLILTEREWHEEDCGWLSCYDISMRNPMYDIMEEEE